ncbi:MAG TPA: hypothetical protein VFV65_04925 [Gemmatimonadales bacterium]|nr:hypothetical protein [Gemmatimonadales bacterium]
MIHAFLLVHATTTLVLATVMWVVQVTVVPRLAGATPQAWPRHASLHRRIFRWLFWPVVTVEALSGIGIAILQPPGIPAWLHALNLGLICTAWCTTLVIRARMGHGPVARYNPAGFHHYARLNWIRVGVWTCRSGIVVAMLRLAATARG